MSFTYLEKLEAVEREIGYRKRVFPRMIDNGKMTAQFANRQISIFLEIADELRELARKERLL